MPRGVSRYKFRAEDDQLAFSWAYSGSTCLATAVDMISRIAGRRRSYVVLPAGIPTVPTGETYIHTQ